MLRYLDRWISLVNTFLTIYICLGFGEELKVLEGLQVIAFFSNPYHPYYSIAPGLSKVSPHYTDSPRCLRPSADALGGPEALIPVHRLCPPTALNVTRLIRPFLRNH